MAEDNISLFHVAVFECERCGLRHEWKTPEGAKEGAEMYAKKYAVTHFLPTSGYHEETKEAK